ncbi:hypothetical protein TNCV_2212951 [Trichonephila clavipes]|nr:hypothetical protein TNCV_2212951 [Trichonephila clavipes]
MGAVLTQLTEQGEEHPILYLIMTDHNPLVWLNRNVSSNPRLMRWALALQPYNFRIVHRSEKGDPSRINILHKYRVNRLLIQAYIENYDCKPSTKDKLDLAKDIVCTFPVLKGSDGEGYEQWFSPGVRGAPATGFIADRFKNFRVRNLSVVEKKELGIGLIKRNIKEKILKYQGTEDSSVEFLQKQQWLKENTSSLDKIEAEFNMLYGEQKSDSLCLGFGMTANLIIHQAKHCGSTVS